MLLTTKLQTPTDVFWDLECYLVANAHVNVIYLAYTRKMFYDGHTVESLDGSGNLRDPSICYGLSSCFTWGPLLSFGS